MFMNGHGKQTNDCSANIFQLNLKCRHTDMFAFRWLSVQDNAYVKIRKNKNILFQKTNMLEGVLRP